MRKAEVKHIGTIHTLNIDQYPSKCGTCNANIDPTYIAGAFIRPQVQDKKYLELAFQCPSTECNSLLIGYYTKSESVYYYQRTEPTSPIEELFSGEVKEVSENFIQIYNQSYYAEQNKLDLISGIGYRKALEFLIKDYLIYLEPDNKEDILKKQLNPCINMLENHNIKEMARRATWIGNDEAHYVRKWEDKDINDLKKLIEVTVYYIAMEVTSEKYLKEMT